MGRQIAQLRGQMHKLQEIIINNRKEIDTNLNMASKASESNKKRKYFWRPEKQVGFKIQI